MAKKVMKKLKRRSEEKMPKTVGHRKMERKDRVRWLLRVFSWRTVCVNAAKKE